VPPRKWEIRIQDILGAVSRIEKYTEGMTEEAFIANSLVIDAVTCNLAVIGEASSHIPESLQEKYPDIPWHLMRGLRNVLVHEYFRINPAILWETVKLRLEPMKTSLQTVIHHP
jgi:uncharacterized protein with HEPN domain